MLKWLGVGTVFAACMFFGFYKAAELKFREKRLLEICLFIDAASDKIRVGQEMNSIIESCGKRAGFYKEGFSIRLNPENLNQTDIKLAEDFILGLGMGDTASELKRCETYSQLFKRELSSAEAQSKEKASIYSKLGVFVGMLVGIVLI